MFIQCYGDNRNTIVIQNYCPVAAERHVEGDDASGRDIGAREETWKEKGNAVQDHG